MHEAPKPHNPFQKLAFSKAPSPNNPNNFGDFTSESRTHFDAPSDHLPPKPFSRAYIKPTFTPPPQISQIMENPLTQMGFEYSKSHISNFINSGTGKCKNWIFNDKTRTYFDIDQETLLKKIGFSLFPFTSENHTDEDQRKLNGIYQPELYLPLLSLVTFVMISSLHGIFAGKTTQPAEIVNQVIQCLFFTAFESFLGKIAVFFGANISVDFFDFVCFCGYKYVVFF